MKRLMHPISRNHVASPMTVITIIIERLHVSRSHVRVGRSDSEHKTFLKKKNKKKALCGTNIYRFLRHFALTRRKIYFKNTVKSISIYIHRIK